MNCLSCTTTGNFQKLYGEPIGNVSSPHNREGDLTNKLSFVDECILSFNFHWLEGSGAQSEINGRN
jgi:hypothetical protein